MFDHRGGKVSLGLLLGSGGGILATRVSEYYEGNIQAQQVVQLVLIFWWVLLNWLLCWSGGAASRRQWQALRRRPLRTGRRRTELVGGGSCRHGALRPRWRCPASPCRHCGGVQTPLVGAIRCVGA